MTIAPLFGPIPGGPEMLIILLVLVLLFGANKIPKLARSTGQAMGEFQKGREEIDQELQEMQDGEDDAGDDAVFVDEAPTAESESESGSGSEPEPESGSASESVESEPN